MLTELQKTIHESAPLGQKTPYPKNYDKGLLHPVSRQKQRDAMNLPKDIDFYGFDIWNAYELFWHDVKGKPVRACASFVIDAHSPNISESKSVKLYLNSLNHERFSSTGEVSSIIAKDLSEICQKNVEVHISPLSLHSFDSVTAYKSLDNFDIEFINYVRSPEILKIEKATFVNEKLVTHLFKSHCLCTGQPDMGSIFIEYEGYKIDSASLLSYLVSYRDHVGFSENCIEQIFMDLMEHAQPSKLLVFGRFTRRGGIDINPYRSTHEIKFRNERLIYQ